MSGQVKMKDKLFDYELNNKDKSYETFIIDTLQKSQIWHSEWITSDKYNFI